MPFGLDMDRLAAPLARARYEQGWLAGRAEALDPGARRAAALDALAGDVLASAALEGRRLHRGRVRAALEVGLGLARHRAVDGLVHIALDAARDPAAPLTGARLGDWHAALRPPGRRNRAGVWRDDAAREATAAFLDWLDGARDDEPVLTAGLAHLRLLAIRPFAYGNGAIARAVTDLALARAEETGVRFYSLAARIQRERAAYEAELKAALAGGTDATGWLEWFFGCIARTTADAATTLLPAPARDADQGLNPRQRTVLVRLRAGSPPRIASSGWAAMTGCSRDTAIRDINDLLARGILARSEAGGRSTRYAPAEGRDGNGPVPSPRP